VVDRGLGTEGRTTEVGPAGLALTHQEAQMRSLCRKVDATSRQRAVARARALELIDR